MSTCCDFFSEKNLFSNLDPRTSRHLPGHPRCGGTVPASLRLSLGDCTVAAGVCLADPAGCPSGGWGRRSPKAGPASSGSCSSAGRRCRRPWAWATMGRVRSRMGPDRFRCVSLLPGDDRLRFRNFEKRFFYKEQTIEKKQDYIPDLETFCCNNVVF